MHVFVYKDVRTALKALSQGIAIIQAKRIAEDRVELFSDYVFFRGQPDATQRLLPTRLRGAWIEPPPRTRYDNGAPPEAREEYGDWFEEVEPILKWLPFLPPTDFTFAQVKLAHSGPLTSTLWQHI